MARYTIAGRSTVVGTPARGQFSLYGVASRRGKIVECGIFNAAAVAFVAALARFTNATGVGTGLTEGKHDDLSPDAELTGFAGHTADSAVSDIIRQASIGDAIGSGVIWTFNGLMVPAGTANGVGVTVPSGTGQLTDFALDWEE